LGLISTFFFIETGHHLKRMRAMVPSDATRQTSFGFENLGFGGFGFEAALKRMSERKRAKKTRRDRPADKTSWPANTIRNALPKPWSTPIWRESSLTFPSSQ
jgi:hypothetical protein